MDEMVEAVASALAFVMEDPDLVNRVDVDTDILHDIGIDSLRMIRFLLDVEERFDTEIDFEALETRHLESVGAFCRFARREAAQAVGGE